LSKIANFNLHHLHLAPPLGISPRLSFAKIFISRKLESLKYRVALLGDPTFSRFSRTPTCNRQTDRRTVTDGQTRDAS